MADNGLVVVIVDGTPDGYVIDITPVAGVVPRTYGQITDPNFLGSNFVDYIDTFFVFNEPKTFFLYISLSEANFAMLTGVPGQVYGGQILAGGLGYIDGTYQSVATVDGTGTGLTLDLTIVGGIVTIANQNQGGEGYAIGDVLTITDTSIGTVGRILDGSLTNAGSGYDGTGSYTDVPLTGGTGTGATANITIAGEVITSFALVNVGLGYSAGDILTANATDLGGVGTGLAWTVNSVSGGFSWQVTAVHGAGFDPLDIAAKNGFPDPIQRVACVHREVWPVGTVTSETWVNSGAADFTLQPLPGAFIQHGCIAPFSVAKWDNSLFWLSQDPQGKALVVMTKGYSVQEISTHAIAEIFQGYTNIADAISYVYQVAGHVFYIISFPSADATWGMDLQTKQWYQWASIDDNGNFHRHRVATACYAYGRNIGADWQTGVLYEIDPNVYTDNGQAIPRIRSFPHLLNDGKRVKYLSFIADMQVGTADALEVPDPPMVSLRWSDDRGVSYGNPVEQSMGATGAYLTQIKWWRLGKARDRVFELSWSAPVKTALNGAFVEMEPERT
jgi:hypothetical protein